MKFQGIQRNSGIGNGGDHRIIYYRVITAILQAQATFANPGGNYGTLGANRSMLVPDDPAVLRRRGSSGKHRKSLIYWMVAKNTLGCDRRSVSGLRRHCKAVESQLPQAGDSIGDLGGQVEGPESTENNEAKKWDTLAYRSPLGLLSFPCYSSESYNMPRA